MIRDRHIVPMVRCQSFGDPEEVLEVVKEEVPMPGPGEVLVRMKAAPINPADINVIQGRYGDLPDLPARMGQEGAGVVEAVGEGVTSLEVGQRVRPCPGVGCWSGALLAAPCEIMRLPEGLTYEQAATLTVNPATAWRLLHDFEPLAPGDWVVHNAASSQVGMAVVRLARHLGLRTVSVVRRREAADELLALGTDLALMDGPGVGQKVRECCAGQHAPRLALDAVGGQSALELARSLARGGSLVVYGALGKTPLHLPGGILPRDQGAGVLDQRLVPPGLQWGDLGHAGAPGRALCRRHPGDSCGGALSPGAGQGGGGPRQASGPPRQGAANHDAVSVHLR